MEKIIHNVENNEIIKREFTEDELAQYELDQIEAAERIVKETEKASAKAALLEKLGITEEEAKLLLS